MIGLAGSAICGGMVENVGTQHTLGYQPAGRVVDVRRHLGRDALGLEKIGDVLLRTADSGCKLGLGAKDGDGSLDMGPDLHTSFLVSFGPGCNKETCHAPHKGAGIVARAMSIAQNVKRLRRQAGLSQVQLAAASGISQQLISQIEAGRNNTTKHLPALAKALGCKLTDIDPSLMDVVSDDPYPDRYLRLSETDRLVVQALIERLERSRGE